MEHHRPHATAAFEGYYSKFDLPSGAKLALIMCHVKGAPRRANMVSFTYVPKDSNEDIFQRELWVEKLHMARMSNHSFVLDAPGVGRVVWHDDSTAEYEFETETIRFSARTQEPTAWASATNTPERFLVNLPLPLHWHVNSLSSRCSYKLEISGRSLQESDKSGLGTVHEEKNWATSFPSAHMWVQVRDENRGFCCAGGQILGLEAFLLGYRSQDLELDFRPPFAMSIAGWSPFMSYNVDWANRRFELAIQDFRKKIRIKAQAPRGTFFALSSPFPEGHRENYLTQSFHAELEVDIFECRWLGSWRLVRSERFSNVSLEFGGAYYPAAGSEERCH